MAFIERNSCDACGASDRQTQLITLPYTAPVFSALPDRYKGKLTSNDLKDAMYEIVKCGNCGFLYQKYIPDDELAERMYSYEKDRIEWSLSKKRDAGIDYFSRYALLVEKSVLILGKSPHKTQVLDFGSGWGYFLRMAEAHGCKVQGIEISSERIAFTQKAGMAVARNIDEVVGKYDFIYSDQTFEHISRPLVYLKQLSAVLEDNGILYVEVPNCRGVEDRIHEAKVKMDPHLFPLEHVNGFSNKSLRALAAQAGLEIIPARTIWKSLARVSSLKRNAQFLQEGTKAFYTQRFSTALYFRKRAWKESK